MSGPIDRPTSRVILVDATGRVLLIGGTEGGRKIWICPGGGCWPDEEPIAGACRELAEETGLKLSPEQLGAHIAQARGEWTAANGTVYAARDHYFAARVEAFTPVADGQEEFERDWIEEMRWWTPDEIEATEDTVWPIGLAQLVRRIANDDLPSTPIQLAWR